VVALSLASACGGTSLVGEFAGGIEGRSERFTVSIDAVDATGAVRGRVRIGEPPEGGFPAPRAEVGYPPDATPPELSVLVDNGVAGFEHPVREARLSDGTMLMATISFVDFWRDWCASLDGNPATGRQFVIAPSGCFVVDEGGQHVAVDCGKLALLNQLGVCFCTPDGCAEVSTVSRATLTLTVDDDDHLSGRFSRASGTLRLARVREGG